MKRSVDLNPKNRFSKNELSRVHEEGIDIPNDQKDKRTRFLDVFPKSIVNAVTSPDVGMDYSVNPYQGCEHGCSYCYARNSHQYWGYSAGLDFEQQILIKRNAPVLLEQKINSKGWKVKPIALSGNTDCYQPVERKLKITRNLLELFLKYHHPVSIITKNAMVLRDIDLLKELSKLNLVRVMISVTTLDDKLRQRLEPRTSSIKKRLETVQMLSSAGVPVGVMMAPIIPGLTSHEILPLAKEVSSRGAVSMGGTLIRLNGHLSEIFREWLEYNYPHRTEKVLNQIKSVHGGRLNDSRFSKRMKGEGEYASMVKSSLQLAKSRYFVGRSYSEYNISAFKPSGQLNLFA